MDHYLPHGIERRYVMSDNRPGRKSFELREPKDMRYAGKAADSELAKELLKLIGIGVAGGIATIAGARKFGEQLLDLQDESARKAEEQRERYKAAVREAVANEIEAEYEQSDDELTLTPSPLAEQPPAVDLVLESAVPKSPGEITFEGQEDAEDRLARAMAEYDAAMDEAALK